MDAWAWSAIQPWLADRMHLPVGPPFCVIDGPTRGRAWSDSAARVERRQLALKAGVRRRFAPPPAAPRTRRRAHARRNRTADDPTPARPPTPVNDRHLPRGINNEEIISTVPARRAPLTPASASIALWQTIAVALLRFRTGRCSPAEQQWHTGDAASPIQQSQSSVGFVEAGARDIRSRSPRYMAIDVSASGGGVSPFQSAASG